MKKKRDRAENLLEILGDLDDNYLKEAEPDWENEVPKQSIKERKKYEIRWLIPCAMGLLYLCLFGGAVWVAKAEENRKNEYDQILERIEKIEQGGQEELNQSEEKKVPRGGDGNSKYKNYQKYLSKVEHVDGCKSKLIRIKGCLEIDHPDTSGFYHLYEMTADGPVYCRVTQTYGLHDIYCAGCEVYICSEIRVCTYEHEKCGITFSGLCQR